MGYLYQRASSLKRRPFQISEELKAAFRRDPPVRSSVTLKNGNGAVQSQESPAYTVHGLPGHWAIKRSS